MKQIINLSEEFKSTAVRYLLALVIVVAIGSMIILAHGEDPVNAFQLIIEGAFGTKRALGNTLRHATPAIIAGIAASVAFKCGINNLGIEGQLYFGALVSALVGHYLSLPPVVHVVFCLMCGMLSGILYAFIPALLRLYFNISELVVSLMLNYVAVLLTEYITMWWVMGGGSVHLAQGSDAVQTPRIAATAELPNLIKGTSCSWGLFIALLAVVFVYILFEHTLKGYELKQVGENIRFAQVGGVNITKTFFTIFLLSGAIAGLGGAIETTGSYGRFTAKFAPNIGWNGIMIAHIAERNPLGVAVVGTSWGALNAGALRMERATSLNKLTVNILQMLFVLFVSIDYRAVVQKIRTEIKRKKGEL